MKNKLFTPEKIVIYILSALLGICTILDLYTAYSSPIFTIAEANPLYMNYGVYALTAVNFVWMVVVIMGLKKAIKLLTLFGFVMACLLLSYGHIIGMQANMEATSLYYQNPEKVMNYIKYNITEETKTQEYNEVVINKIFIPYIISLIGFIIIFYLYNKRKPIRDKYVDDAIKLLNKIKE
jgi:hypothetical protein